MKKASASEQKGLSPEEKAERLLRAIRPIVARAIEDNNVRRGAKSHHADPQLL